MVLLGGFLMTIEARAESAFPVERFEVARVVRSMPERDRAYAVEQKAAIQSWKRSLLPLVATQGLDIASSYGMRELNPLLAGADGRFGGKAAGIKIGATAAAVGIEYLIVKKWPGAARVFSKVNWGSSALTGAIAAHNFAIK